MTDEQPEALRLADWLDAPIGNTLANETEKAAAAELRRFAAFIGKEVQRELSDKRPPKPYRIDPVRDDEYRTGLDAVDDEDEMS